MLLPSLVFRNSDRDDDTTSSYSDVSLNSSRCHSYRGYAEDKLSLCVPGDDGSAYEVDIAQFLARTEEGPRCRWVGRLRRVWLRGGG